jgi:hypothetical protein
MLVAAGALVLVAVWVVTHVPSVRPAAVDADDERPGGDPAGDDPAATAAPTTDGPSRRPVPPEPAAGQGRHRRNGSRRDGVLSPASAPERAGGRG